MSAFGSTVLTPSDSSVSVLRNTYQLLSLTLFWSAIAAYLGMHCPVASTCSLGLFVGAFVLLFATCYYRDSGFGVLLVFAFTGLMGFSLGPVLSHQFSLPHGAETVGLALLTTGGITLALSAYVHIAKKDFNAMGGFLFAALMGLIAVGSADIFFPTPGLTLLLSYASALIFCGFILWDTSDIVSGRQTNYITATIGLYLDILNLFTSLLRIFSGGK